MNHSTNKFGSVVLEENPKLGFYSVGDQIYYSKVQALIEGTRTNQFPVWNFNNKVFGSQTWTEEPDIGLREIYRMRAQQLRDQYDYIRIECSGGGDSAQAVYNFLLNDIHVDEILFRFPKEGQKQLPPDPFNFHVENHLSEIASSKYSNWSDVPTNKRLTIATSGLGVVSHLVALQFQKKYPDSVVVPFKSTTDAILATVGGQTDFVVGFVGDQEKWATENSKVKLHILGATGAKPSGKYQTLASQGFPQSLAKMNTPYTFMVPTSFKEEKAIEIRKILVEAEKAQSVRNSYALDYCAPFQVPENQLKSWWDEQNAFWTSLTVGVKLEQ